MKIDVRSPCEYLHAHIPGALNLPLFSDEERQKVGLLYKQEGKDKALELGLELVGPKLARFVAEAKKLSGPLTVYCARGGMRSEAMTWLLSFAGIPCERLNGGYKAYRKRVLAVFSTPLNLRVLGGYTGTGKTEHLQVLKNRGEQVIDLEALAKHRGSVFGYQTPQPSNEHFENLLAEVLFELDPERPIWVEDESSRIGLCKIPDPFFHQMKKAPKHLIHSPLEERIQRLLSEYGAHPKEALSANVLKLTKRLGHTRTSSIIEHIQNDRLPEAIQELLAYYDAAYDYSQSRNLV